MLNFPPAVRIWLGNQSVDMRRGFDGLAEQVRQHLQADPLSGHVFVFRNKRGDRLKLLYWDEDGFVIVYKRLERGTFRWPALPPGQQSIRLRAAELTMLLYGIDWQTALATAALSPAGDGVRCGAAGAAPFSLFYGTIPVFYASNSHEPHPSRCRAAANRRAIAGRSGHAQEHDSRTARIHAPALRPRPSGDAASTGTAAASAVRAARRTLQPQSTPALPRPSGGCARGRVPRRPARRSPSGSAGRMVAAVCRRICHVCLSTTS